MTEGPQERAPPVWQVGVMSAIVATLAFVPVGVFLTGVCFLLDVSLRSFLTFGGTFSEPVGLLAWWTASLVPAAVYTALCMRT